VYYTSDRQVAKMYADSRAIDSGTGSRAYVARVDMSTMRVLDLTKDPRWKAYLSSQPTPQSSVEQLIRMANENYSRFFEAFLKNNKINLAHYDAVIGPEFVRGGKQMCVLLKVGKQTSHHAAIRAVSEIFYANGKEVLLRPASPRPVQQLPSAIQVLTPKSRVGRVAGNQAAAAMIGVALGGLAQWLGGIGIERKIRTEIETTHAKQIEAITARGEGVLLIIGLMEWETPNDLGMRSRSFLSVNVQGGSTKQAAIEQWQMIPRLLQGAPKGWRVITQYAWLPPHGVEN
jgi:hypothetical protein